MTSRRITSLIGQGFKNSKQHTCITNHFLRNPHIYSPYTPYQSEISQGRLELQYHYQRCIAQLTGKDMAVASLIDAGQVAMDIVSMMTTSSKRKVILVDPSIYQPIKNCMNTRAFHQGVTLLPFACENGVIIVDPSTTPDDIGGIVCSKFNAWGEVQHDLFSAIDNFKKESKNIQSAIYSDLLSAYVTDNSYSSIFDYHFGNGSDIGIGLSFGGPQPAFLSFDASKIRHIPGKIITTGQDIHGNTGYRLALQTREQHIKREKATSNVCTNQALLACMSAAHAIYEGNEGLHESAIKTRNLARLFADNIDSQLLETKRESIFDTVVIEDREDTYRHLIAEGFYPHRVKESSSGHTTHLSFTFDDTMDESVVEHIVHMITGTPPSQQRSVNPTYSMGDVMYEDMLVDDIFHKHTGNEQSLLRYLHQLGSKDYSLLNGMIPLGSCTMKHTPVNAMDAVFTEGANIHPYVPIEDTTYGTVVERLSRRLCDITGFEEVFFQSQSGAMGEYAGLSMIRNYHKHNHNNEKRIIILPKSAHGTNASSAVLAGFDVKYVDETKNGTIDMNSLHKLIHKNRECIAGAMITYPSTYGQYEPNIEQITKAIHDAGGLMYMDGANMNALVGKEGKRVAELGFDVCHFNLHKSFAIPHGGGGPGMGPIATRREFAKFLPEFSTQHDTYSISTTPYGSGLILRISDHYLTHCLTPENEAMFHSRVRENTNYVMNELANDYTVLHGDSTNRAHEFIIDVSSFKPFITEVDICKRLIDYGFHGPTMSYPVLHSLMIEVTESEDKSEIERFVHAMKQIRREIDDRPDMLRNAPHTMYDVAHWSYDYSVNDACFPGGVNQYKTKVWATINRMNDAKSDRDIMKVLRSK